MKQGETEWRTGSRLHLCGVGTSGRNPQNTGQEEVLLEFLGWLQHMQADMSPWDHIPSPKNAPKSHTEVSPINFSEGKWIDRVLKKLGTPWGFHPFTGSKDPEHVWPSTIDQTRRLPFQLRRAACLKQNICFSSEIACSPPEEGTMGSSKPL